MLDDVSRLLAIEDIKQLKARHCRFADSSDFVQYMELFTEDAVIDVRGATRADDEGLFTGPRAFVDHFNAARIAGTRSAHHLHNSEVEILSSETARGIFATAVHIWLPEGAPYRNVSSFGYYHDDFVKRDGRWLISSLKVVRIHSDVQ